MMFPESETRSLLRSSPGALVALLSALLAAPLSAQTASVTGVVINGDTGEPLASVQVALEGTGRGEITNSEGRYLILNVPAGETEMVVSLIGYREVRRTLSIGTGASEVVDISLFPRAVELEGVVGDRDGDRGPAAGKSATASRW